MLDVDTQSIVYSAENDEYDDKHRLTASMMHQCGQYVIQTPPREV